MTQAATQPVEIHLNQQICCVSALISAMQVEAATFMRRRCPGAVFVLYEHAWLDCAPVNFLGAIVLMNHDFPSTCSSNPAYAIC